VRAVVFDLDGTLVDSVPDIHAAANALLSWAGAEPLPLEQVQSFVGNGIPKLVERVMQARGIACCEARHLEFSERFKAFYAEKPAELTRLYSGVSDALNSLKDAGFKLGVCTNKAYDLTLRVLDGIGLEGCFDAVIGGDTLPEHKPSPAPLFACIALLGADEAIFVGDSEVDAATAEAAKTPFALFTEGYRKSPVAMLRHDVAFSSYAALPPVVPALFARQMV